MISLPKIEIEVKKVGHESTWKEEYVIDNNITPLEWAEKTIEKFNATLYPGESPRELVGVQVLNEIDKPNEHKWVKTNLFTIVRGSNVYDTMECEHCRITGKRRGLGSEVARDSKYKAKKYENCIG